MSNPILLTYANERVIRLNDPERRPWPIITNWIPRDIELDNAHAAIVFRAEGSWGLSQPIRAPISVFADPEAFRRLLLAAGGYTFSGDAAVLNCLLGLLIALAKKEKEEVQDEQHTPAPTR